jgi:hypothetical protein
LDALWLGYDVVAWTEAAYDWLDHDAGWIFDWLAPGLRPGCVILLHDALYQAPDLRYADREPMLRAVEMLLGRFGGRFRFVSVPELRGCGRPRRVYWQVSPDPGGPRGASEQVGTPVP